MKNSADAAVQIRIKITDFLKHDKQKELPTIPTGDPKVTGVACGRALNYIITLNKKVVKHGILENVQKRYSHTNSRKVVRYSYTVAQGVSSV